MSKFISPSRKRRMARQEAAKAASVAANVSALEAQSAAFKSAMIEVETVLVEVMGFKNMKAFPKVIGAVHQAVEIAQKVNLAA